MDWVKAALLTGLLNLLLMNLAPETRAADFGRGNSCRRGDRLQIQDLDMSPDPVVEGQRVREWKVHRLSTAAAIAKPTSSFAKATPTSAACATSISGPASMKFRSPPPRVSACAGANTASTSRSISTAHGNESTPTAAFAPRKKTCGQCASPKTVGDPRDNQDRPDPRHGLRQSASIGQVISRSPSRPKPFSTSPA